MHTSSSRHRQFTFSRLSIRALAAAALLLFLTSLHAEDHTGGVPELSSNPGAPFTIYLNVAGFNFDGQWNGQTPGFTPSLNDVASTGTFNATEQEQIKILWARMAQSYAPFNVNVTTIDPAVAAGMAGTDAMRQAYYDSQTNLMHTVIGSQVRDNGMGGTVKWYSNDADGVSGLGVNSTTSSGGNHTNWMFTEAQAGAATGGIINGNYIGTIAAHENGHAYNLTHQSDYSMDTAVNEYSLGDNAAGNGSYVAIMGQADGRQRFTWRSGDSNNGQPGHQQNDVGRMLASNPGLVLVEDGIGHSILTATPLSITSGGSVDFNIATGVIVPVSASKNNRRTASPFHIQSPERTITGTNTN